MDPKKNIVNLVKVDLSFGGRSILEDVNCVFKFGTTYIVRGVSGVGKTTLLNMIAGYLKPNAGEIDVAQNTKIEYLFQDEMLFGNLTVRENILIKYLKLHNSDEDFDQKVTAALERFGIKDLIDRKVGLLSGGEKQRVQLTNIYLSDPGLILMDEPTSKLDSYNKEKITEIINQTFNGKAMIIVTHEKWPYTGECVHLTLENRKLTLSNKQNE